MERQSREAHLSGNSDRLAAELAVCSRSIRGVDVKATAEGPLSLSELDRRYGHHGYRSAMRFGVDEGLDEAGDTKWRPCDDLTASGVNDTVTLPESVLTMANDFSAEVGRQYFKHAEKSHALPRLRAGTTVTDPTGSMLR